MIYEGGFIIHFKNCMLRKTANNMSAMLFGVDRSVVPYSLFFVTANIARQIAVPKIRLITNSMIALIEASAKINTNTFSVG